MRTRTLQARASQEKAHVLRRSTKKKEVNRRVQTSSLTAANIKSRPWCELPHACRVLALKLPCQLSLMSCCLFSSTHGLLHLRLRQLGGHPPRAAKQQGRLRPANLAAARRYCLPTSFLCSLRLQVGLLLSVLLRAEPQSFPGLRLRPRLASCNSPRPLVVRLAHAQRAQLRGARDAAQLARLRRRGAAGGLRAGRRTDPPAGSSSGTWHVLPFRQPPRRVRCAAGEQLRQRQSRGCGRDERGSLACSATALRSGAPRSQNVLKS